MLPVFEFTDQPDLDCPLNPEFPAPSVLLRPFGPGFLLSRQGEITAASYSGNTAVGSPAGKAVRFAGGASDGALFTSNRPLNRSLYSCAVKFRLEVLGVNQVVMAFNGSVSLNLRINTSDQLDLVADGVAVLDTSSFTFRLGTVYTLVLTVFAGSTFVFVNGQRIIAFAGVRDLQATDQSYSLGRRGPGLTTQALQGSFIEAAFWNPNAPLTSEHAYGGILTPVEAYLLSIDYNQLFLSPYGVFPKKASSGIANAPGASFTWGWTFSGGAASATQTANAPAAAFAWSWEFVGGAASTGGTAANAPGADFTWTLALSAGAASVTANPSAPGAALGWNWAFSGGAASVPGTGTLPQVVLYVGDNLAIGTNGQPVVVLFV